MNTNDPYLAYYRQQQSGRGVTSVYRGAAFQRGHGIGSFLSGLVRTVAPLIRSGAAALGKEALRSGVGFLSDMATGTSDPRVAANARLKQLTGAMKRKADEKLDRVLSGGGVAKKRRRVGGTRKRRLTGGTTKKKGQGGRGYKKGRARRVTPQLLAKLLSTPKRKPVKRKKTKRKTVKRKSDIFG
jgi:hypothetical protein